MSTKTVKFKLTVVFSVIYVIFVSLIVFSEASRYDGIADQLLPILIFTSPVWIFWVCVWIWPNKFFNPKNDELKKWIAVTREEAQRHRFYGVSGWSVLLVIGLFFSPFRILLGFYKEEIDLSQFAHISGFETLYRVEEVTNWGLAGLSWIIIYVLFSHKSKFQIIFLLYFLISFIVPFVDAIAVVNVFKGSNIEIKFEDVFPEQELIRHIAMIFTSAIWVFYVFRSKRINITTRFRYRKRDEHLLRKFNEEAGKDSAGNA